MPASSTNKSARQLRRAFLLLIGYISLQNKTTACEERSFLWSFLFEFLFLFFFRPCILFLLRDYPYNMT